MPINNLQVNKYTKYSAVEPMERKSVNLKWKYDFQVDILNLLEPKV